MELGLGFVLAEATVRESERVQCRRGEELARDPLIHPRTVLGRSTAREGGSASLWVATAGGERDDRMVLLLGPWKFLWFSQVGPSPFYFLFSFISFQYLNYLGKQMDFKFCKFGIVGKLI